MPITMRVKLPSHFELRTCEWMLGLIQFGWGLILLSPAPIFSQNPYFSVMAQIASQGVWGTACVISGGLHLLALYWNGTRQKSPHLRAACSAIGALMWFQITLGFVATKVVTPGWAVYSVFFVFSIYNVIRAMFDARTSDEKAKAGGFDGHRRKWAT